MTSPHDNGAYVKPLEVGVKIDGHPKALHITRPGTSFSWCGRMLKRSTPQDEVLLPYCRACNDEANVNAR